MTKKLIKTQCPHCENIYATKKGYVDCEVCGNGYPAKPYEIDDDSEVSA